MDSSSIQLVNIHPREAQKAQSSSRLRASFHAEAGALILNLSSIQEAAVHSMQRMSENQPHFIEHTSQGQAFLSDKQFRTQALDPHCLRWNPNLTTYCLYGLGSF